jgi:glycosyltransferase involved in cell wall biosynthesis
MVSALDQLVQSFDVIHLHEYPTFQNLIVSHYARKYKVPYVIQTHASLANSSYNNLAKILLRKIFDAIIGYRLLNGASRAMALNLTEKQQLINARVDPSKIDIVPNGIDFGEYLELPRIGLFREKHGISNNVKIVLYVGRLDKSKRIDLLIKAFDLVVKKKRNSKLVIIGKDYGALGSLKDLAGHLGIEGDIMFTGFLKKHEKIEALVDSDVFVTPCFYGFPRTFLEACACGLPIITTDKGDRLDWIHNQVGYVARFDERDLSDAILKILIDEETKKLFSQNCRKSAQEEFDWHIVSRKIEDVYIRSKPKL